MVVDGRSYLPNLILPKSILYQFANIFSLQNTRYTVIERTIIQRKSYTCCSMCMTGRNDVVKIINYILLCIILMYKELSRQVMIDDKHIHT